MSLKQTGNILMILCISRFLYTVPTRIIRTLENCVLLTIEGQWNGKFVIWEEGKAIATYLYGYPYKKNRNWRMGNEKRKWANPIFLTLDASNLVFTHERDLIMLISTIKRFSNTVLFPKLRAKLQVFFHVFWREF